MNERTSSMESIAVEDGEEDRSVVDKEGCLVLPPFEFESMKSKVEGTVEGASSCSSRLEVINESHTSASNAPSE